MSIWPQFFQCCELARSNLISSQTKLFVIFCGIFAINSMRFFSIINIAQPSTNHLNQPVHNQGISPRPNNENIPATPWSCSAGYRRSQNSYPLRTQSVATGGWRRIFFRGWDHVLQRSGQLQRMYWLNCGARYSVGGGTLLLQVRHDQRE